MNHPHRKTRHLGIWLMAASGSLGFVFSLRSYFSMESGIDHSVGALLVLVSTTLLLTSAPCLATRRLPGWMKNILFSLIFLDLLATSVAGYFLESWLLLLALVPGFAGWFIHLRTRA